MLRLNSVGYIGFLLFSGIIIKFYVLLWSDLLIFDLKCVLSDSCCKDTVVGVP